MNAHKRVRKLLAVINRLGRAVWKQVETRARTCWHCATASVGKAVIEPELAHRAGANVN